MTLQDFLEQPEGGAMIAQIARQLGVNEETARRGAAQLAPALARGLQRSAGQGSLGELLAGLAGRLGQPQGGVDGNDILGQIFGSKDVSRNVAGYAAERSGVDNSLLKRMLPLLAAALVMYLARQRANAPAGAGQPGGAGEAEGSGTGTGSAPSSTGRQAPGAPGGSLTDMLTQMFDADRDGSVVDDLLDMARKYF